MNGAFQVSKIQWVQVTWCPKYMGRRQNIGKYCACKGALRRGAPRQEFGFKLLFVPDKSALNAGGCCLPHPSTYTYTTTLAFKQEPNLGFQSFKNDSTTQFFCAEIFAWKHSEKVNVLLLKCIRKVSIISLCVKQWKLRRTEVLKVKIYCMLSFYQKKVNPFWSGEKLQKVYKNVKYLGLFGQ